MVNEIRVSRRVIWLFLELLSSTSLSRPAGRKLFNSEEGLMRVDLIPATKLKRGIGFTAPHSTLFATPY